MADFAELHADLEALLEPAAFADAAVNGLQVPGRRDVAHVVTGVTAQLELFERAVALDADLVLVHHGLFWSFHPPGLGTRQLARLRPLLERSIGLLAYHLPLDAHPAVGNNALLAAGLGVVDPKPFAHHGGRAIGRWGRLERPLAVEELLERAQALCGGRAPLLQGAGPTTVETVGVVSGAAAGDLDEAVALGCDLFLTGEPREHVMADATEAGVHFVAAGHYATETHGIRALGDRLAERFGVRHSFVDVPNPV